MEGKEIYLARLFGVVCEISPDQLWPRKQHLKFGPAAGASSGMLQALGSVVVIPRLLH